MHLGSAPSTLLLTVTLATWLVTMTQQVHGNSVSNVMVLTSWLTVQSVRAEDPCSLFNPNVLKPKMCKFMERQCAIRGFPIQWFGGGCGVGDGGCRCATYCGFTCMDACVKSKYCGWEPGVGCVSVLGFTGVPRTTDGLCEVVQVSTSLPTVQPSSAPTAFPTPSIERTVQPTSHPGIEAASSPVPTAFPLSAKPLSAKPSSAPAVWTTQPTTPFPTTIPVASPNPAPVLPPSIPSISPSHPTSYPTAHSPTVSPIVPTSSSSTNLRPSRSPTRFPTYIPTTFPTLQPTGNPT